MSSMGPTHQTTAVRARRAAPQQFDSVWTQPMGSQPFPLSSRIASEMIVCEISCQGGVKVLVTSVSSG